MSQISKEGYEQIKIIKNALDSMYDKLNRTVYVPKGKSSKNIDGSYDEKNVFDRKINEMKQCWIALDNLFTGFNPDDDAG